MSEQRSASERIIEEVGDWPGVEVGKNARGGLAFFGGRKEIGHLHGDDALHTGFPKEQWQALKDEGRIVDHPVFPASRARPHAGSRMRTTCSTPSSCCG
jgi:hypothetical protein